jgi:hypothetical protein
MVEPDHFTYIALIYFHTHCNTTFNTVVMYLMKTSLLACLTLQLPQTLARCVVSSLPPSLPV